VSDARHVAGLPRQVLPTDFVLHKRDTGQKSDCNDEDQSYKLGHYMSAEARMQEVSALKGVVGACMGQKPNKDQTAAFLLPAAAEGDSTTKISVKTRKVSRQGKPQQKSFTQTNSCDYKRFNAKLLL